MQIASNPTPNERFGHFLDALRGESDRGAALAAAFAEELLEEILRNFLADVPETKDLMRGFSAPIGSYGSKIKFAYVLGLLDKELLTGLNVIRKIRNAFAHEWEPLAFSQQRMTDLVENIPQHPILSGYPQPRSPRMKFDSCVSAVLMEMCFIPGLIKEQKRRPTRIVRFGKIHEPKEAAQAEHEEYMRTGIPPVGVRPKGLTTGSTRMLRTLRVLRTC